MTSEKTSKRKLLWSLLKCFLAGPLIFLVLLYVQSWFGTKSAFPELMLVVVFYIYSIILLLAPCAVALLFLALLPSSRFDRILGALLFLLSYPAVQVGALLLIADALSSARPDDPSMMEQWRSSILTFSAETRIALFSGVCVAGWLLPLKKNGPETLSPA